MRKISIGSIRGDLQIDTAKLMNRAIESGMDIGVAASTCILAVREFVAEHGSDAMVDEFMRDFIDAVPTIQEASIKLEPERDNLELSSPETFVTTYPIKFEATGQVKWGSLVSSVGPCERALSQHVNLCDNGLYTQGIYLNEDVLTLFTGGEYQFSEPYVVGFDDDLVCFDAYFASRAVRYITESGTIRRGADLGIQFVDQGAFAVYWMTPHMRASLDITEVLDVANYANELGLQLINIDNASFFFFKDAKTPIHALIDSQKTMSIIVSRLSQYNPSIDLSSFERILCTTQQMWLSDCIKFLSQHDDPAHAFLLALLCGLPLGSFFASYFTITL